MIFPHFGLNVCSNKRREIWNFLLTVLLTLPLKSSTRKLWNFISLFYIFFCSSFVFPTAHQIVKQSFSEYSSHGFWVVLTLTFVGETRAKQQSGEGRWTWLVLASQAQIILRAYVIFTFEFWVGGVAVLSSPNISQDLSSTLC